MPETTTDQEELEMSTFSGPSERRERSRSKSASHETLLLNKKDYAIGIGLLLIVVFLWTFSNFLTQDLYEGGYVKPFLVTYLNTSSFALYLVPFFSRKIWRWYRGTNGTDRRGLGYQSLANDHESMLHAVQSGAPPPSPPLTTEETVRLAFLFCYLWFIANWSVNASLDYTSVASATILSSMSGFFTLGIGRIFRVETLTIGKIGAVLTSFGGVVLVSFSDSSQTQPSEPSTPSALHVSRPLLGDSLALLSAVFYALYVILLKVRIRSESRIDMQLFFGFVGLFNIISCWPMGLLLHYFGVETFELPSTRKALAAVLINMLITLSSDFIYVLAMLKTTPLVVTIGLSLTIPLAVFGDFFLGRPARFKVILGAIFVLIAFVAIGWEDSKPDINEDIIEDDLLDDHRGRQARLQLEDSEVVGEA